MEDKLKEFNNKQIIDRICDKHQVKFWRIATPIRGSDQKQVQEFCPECAREDIAKRQYQTSREAVNKQLYLSTYDVLMRDSIIPNELKEASFETFQAQTSEEKQLLTFTQNQVKKYLNGMTGNTLITGTVGIGKSHLSLAMAKALNDGYKNKNDPKSVLFVTFADIITKIQDGWRYKQNTNFSEYDAVQFLTTPNFLFLDDLGAKNADIKPKSDWEQDLLFKVLNARETTIINTNLSSTELRTVYNERNYSRILKGLDGNTYKADNIRDKRYKINQFKR